MAIINVRKVTQNTIAVRMVFHHWRAVPLTPYLMVEMPVLTYHSNVRNRWESLGILEIRIITTSAGMIGLI